MTFQCCQLKAVKSINPHYRSLVMHVAALDPDSDPRGLLGKLLREARTEAGLSGEALGRAIGQEKTGVVRAESGERVPTVVTLGAWLSECGVGGLAEAAVRGLWKLARNVENPMQAQLAPWYTTEDRAHTLRFWQPLVVPGLVQVEKYSYEMHRAAGRSHEQAVEGTKARMARQAILAREDGPTVVIVLDELVLHRLIGTGEVMAEQCGRLIDLSEHPSVLIHILPSAQGASPGLGGPVCLASVTGEPDVLLQGSILENVVTTDAQQLRAASGIFERVRGRAANIDGSRTIIGEAMAKWKA
jgi:transcriptional regulator with XRE-family HTH domain